MPSILSSSASSLWHAPTCPAGRTILAGFSYLQRIGKGARTRFWMPSFLASSAVEWAAVRSFDLVQESGNLVIDDLDVTDMRRAMNAWMRMRGGGCRIVVATLGRYGGAGGQDALALLDSKLQEEITRMIHFLYLEEWSKTLTQAHAIGIKGGAWSCADRLPHVAQALAEKRLFKPERQTAQERAFFSLLEALPARHIVQEEAVGLALPDATKEKNWVYLAKEEHRAPSFFGAIGSVIGEAVLFQPRGHGERMGRYRKPDGLVASFSWFFLSFIHACDFDACFL